MLEFLMNLGINMKAFVAAMMTVWTLLSGSGMTVEDTNNFLEYISCLTVDEYGSYLIAYEYVEGVTGVGDTEYAPGSMEYETVGDSLGEALDWYLDDGTIYSVCMEKYSIEWRTYADYEKWEALNNLEG